jgi:small subunit ribosomal protein S5
MAKPERSKKSEGKEERESDGLVDKLIGINRVTNVKKGGKTFKMVGMVVIGDQKGRIGYGTGKSKEVPDAVTKATNAAKRNMIRIPLRDGRTLHHDVRGRYGAGKVVLRTAPAGTGIIAGGPMRALFEVLGIRDIVAKSVGSSNPHNMIKATLAALSQVSSPRAVAVRRGKKVNEILGKKQADEVGAKE